MRAPYFSDNQVSCSDIRQGCGLETKNCGLRLTLLVWSWQSVAALGVVQPVLTLNVEFHPRIHNDDHALLESY